MHKLCDKTDIGERYGSLIPHGTWARRNAIFYDATRVDTFYTTAAIMSRLIKSIMTPENVAWR